MREADRKLVEAVKGGDPAAFESLYDTYVRRIYNFTLGKLSNVAEAEDVTQEVFEAVFTCLDRFEGKSDLVVWIYGITRNLINNRLRRRSQLRFVPLDDVTPEQTPADDGPERLASARESLRRVESVIGELPRDQRRILELRHGQRMSIRKIAEVMHRSEDAVKSSLYRTRRSLAQKLPEAKLELTQP